MKKIKIILFLIAGLSFISGVFAFQSYSVPIFFQSSSGIGSNNSVISFSLTGSSGNVGSTELINEGQNSEILGDYLKGYYYDTVYGFFKLDRNNSNPEENVRIIGSSNKCPSGYGYKFAGLARSEYSGFIDFNYSSDIYVYYCENDMKLHGFAYSKYLGFQNFEGIGFDINPNLSAQISSGSGNEFVNNSSVILDESFSNFGATFSEKSSVDYGSEAIFYIYKPKK